jgi:curved DNA-binding protein CbpA
MAGLEGFFARFLPPTICQLSSPRCCMTDSSGKKNLYEILGVAPGATQAEVKAAYDAQVSDDAPLDPALRVALKEALAVLSNDQKRLAYDSSLKRRAAREALESSTDEVPEPSRMPWVILALAVLVVGAWLSMKGPNASKPAAAAATPTRASPVVAEELNRPAPPQAAAPRPWLGTWHCTGPLTGSGLDLVFDADGSYSGKSDGKPMRGQYTMSANALTLNEPGQAYNFAVEQLSEQGMAISLGEGRRLTCKR